MFFLDHLPESNEELLDQLRASGVVRSPEVEAAMRAIDRGHYAPDAELAYVDAPLPIGHNATISAPHMHAICLEELRDRLARPEARVLDVGSGTGYLVAAAAHMQAAEGREGREGRAVRGDAGTGEGPCRGVVVGIEHIPELQAMARDNLMRDPAARPLLESGRIKLVVGDGRGGWEGEAPYDAIHVGAAAPELPPALTAQLAPGGVMIVPVGPEGGVQALTRVEKAADGGLKVKEGIAVGYVPLCARAHQEAGG